MPVDNPARLRLLARYFRRDFDDFRLAAGTLARSDPKAFGTQGNVPNLFRNEGRLSASEKQDALIVATVAKMATDSGITISSEHARLNSSVENFLGCILRNERGDPRYGLSVEEVLECLHQDEKRLVDIFSNVAVGEALQLPKGMRLKQSALRDSVEPWIGTYAVYRFSRTSEEDLELSEEKLEIDMTATSICRFHGSGGGLYQGVLLMGGKTISVQMHHENSKPNRHMFFFMNLFTSPVSGRGTFYATFSVKTEDNEIRSYNTIIVKKDRDFQHRGADVNDRRLLLLYYPSLQLEVSEVEVEPGLVLNHPVLWRSRVQGQELIRAGRSLWGAYQDNPAKFDACVRNVDILRIAEELVSKS